MPIFFIHDIEQADKAAQARIQQRDDLIEDKLKKVDVLVQHTTEAEIAPHLKKKNIYPWDKQIERLENMIKDNNQK